MMIMLKVMLSSVGHFVGADECAADAAGSGRCSGQ